MTTTNSTPETGTVPPPESNRPGRLAVTRRVTRGLIPILVPLVVLALWEYAGRQRLLADGLFPPATKAAAALLVWIAGSGTTDDLVPASIYSGTWSEHVGASLVRILTGYLIGSALAVVLGLAGGVSLLARRALDPTINAIRPISITAWVPLALVLFGIGDRPAVFLTALATFFPVYINTLSGARYVDVGMIRAARMLGATRGEVIGKVVLPAALPSIAVGLRVAAAIAWTTVVIAEILGAKSGLGYVLIDSYNQFRFDYVIAAMISLGACGFLTDRLVQLAFARPLRWIGDRAH
ncbi:ABC transporter permease [Actinomadura madurae]|uniref:ABC transporter permease n=1 Tax=Actinomadura madurae TaxID=1993 RepID=UPI0020D2265F|nr:ABC transporter permease [Actinomadura madurae]MCQ0009101.1 ABC transporter permease [Actinomadura madurae]MCQ0015579.1 ABC transporter permease [Actinomadura madurae]